MKVVLSFFTPFEYGVPDYGLGSLAFGSGDSRAFVPITCGDSDVTLSQVLLWSSPRNYRDGHAVSPSSGAPNVFFTALFFSTTIAKLFSVAPVLVGWQGGTHDSTIVLTFMTSSLPSLYGCSV